MGHGGTKYRRKIRGVEALLFAVFLSAISFFALPEFVHAATQVYYSVGQNTSDHRTGSPVMTIENGVATFSIAQTATNMGVGDRITYNTSSYAYISGKISTLQWKVVTNLGAAPSNVENATVNSIAHVYQYLSNAESGAESLLGSADLTALDVQLNLPCYYDSAADPTDRKSVV